MIQMSQASDGRGLGRSVHQAAWHVCRPSTPFLCVAASVATPAVGDCMKNVVSLLCIAQFGRAGPPLYKFVVRPLARVCGLYCHR